MYKLYKFSTENLYEMFNLMINVKKRRRNMDKRIVLQSIINYYTDGNKTQFAKLLGITPSAVTAWLRRGTYDVQLICTNCTNINPSYLLTGDGPMLLSRDSKTEEKEEKEVQGINKEDIDKLVARVDELVRIIGTIEQNRATELQQIERTQSLISRMLSVVENMTASLQHHAPLHCTSLHSDAE